MVLPQTQQTKDRNTAKIGQHTTLVRTQYTDHSKKPTIPSPRLRNDLWSQKLHIKWFSKVAAGSTEG